MKFISMIALLFSASVFAETCFVRSANLQTNEVSLAKTLCFAAPELELNYFDSSFANLRYTVDGERAFKRAALKGTFNASGMYVVNVEIENTSAGGFCDETWQANSVVTLEISKDGKNVNVSKVAGELSYSWDNCHSSTDVKQRLSYERL